MSQLPHIGSPGVSGILANPGTQGGEQALDEFRKSILAISGDVRLLWLPKITDTTTTTDSSLNARTFTYDATIATRRTALGSGVTVDFDGTDDEADVPDADNLSFGNSTVDEALSIVMLCKPDANNAAYSLLAKENSSSAEECNFGLNSSGHLVTTLTDESATATIIGTYATPVGTSWILLGSTYDGSRAATGISNYANGAAVTTAASGAGTYVAMENTAALVHLGARYTTKAQFFNGNIAFAVLVAGALNQHQHWAIKTAVKGVFDLAL